MFRLYIFNLLLLLLEDTQPHSTSGISNLVIKVIKISATVIRMQPSHDTNFKLVQVLSRVDTARSGRLNLQEY
jgi:hypothetical protein